MGCKPSTPYVPPTLQVEAPKDLNKNESTAPADREIPGAKTNFKSEYDLGSELGRGAFAVVFNGWKIGTQDQFAVKMVTRSGLSRDEEGALKDEIAVLKDMQHPNIIRLYDVFVEDMFYYLVTEKMLGGELFDRIVEKQTYNEKEARDTCKIVLGAIQYMHDQKVAHRDLKPENLLLLNTKSDSIVKLADFGFAKKCEHPEALSTQCGTPGYVAPEILENERYGTLVDLWSFGCIVYILLGGYKPFQADSQPVLFHLIRKGNYEFHQKYWSEVTDAAKEFISGLLTVDRKKRHTAESALKSEWINLKDDVLASQDLSSHLAQLKETQAKAKKRFKSAVKKMMIVNHFGGLGTVSEEGPLADGAENIVVKTKIGSLGEHLKEDIKESERVE